MMVIKMKLENISKRIIGIILCSVMLITGIAVPVEAKERTLYRLKVNAGDGEHVVPSIIDKGEIYVSAHDFEKFTRFSYNEKTNTFLVKGQEEDKAFKKIKFNTDSKKMVIGTEVINLIGCIVEKEEVYLPLAQLLPVLNAEILGVAKDTIYISNNELSMAELLYDFDVIDYRFDLMEEFYNDVFIASMYIVPSYVFDTVVNFRFDRVDLLMDSGECSDYTEIFKAYLKDDKLFYQAMEEKDSIGEILETLTNLNSESKTLYDVYEWFEHLYKMELDENSLFEFDDVEKILREGYSSEVFEDEFKQILDLSHDELVENGPSAADLIEGLEFLYSFMTQIEDHSEMLDAVYGIKEKQLIEEERKSIPGASVGFFATNPEYMAAENVYDLYNGDITKEAIQKVSEEIADKILEGHDAYKVANWYKITSKLAGEIIELYMPGDSGDRAVLTNHVNIITSALGKATVPDLTTEESTKDYRLSLLLTMIASRRCYNIMKETADGYGQDTSYYENKIEKIENLIKGLYIVAENERFDTYENYETYMQDNQDKVNQSGILDKMERYDVKDIYREFFEENYKNASTTEPIVVDVTGDGVEELIFIDRSNLDSKGEIIGYVHSIDKGKVTKLETKRGALNHGGGYFTWYLYNKGDSWCLAEETYAMWQGRGELEFTAYMLDSKGERNVYDQVSVSSSDTGCFDETGVVTEEAYANYIQALDERLTKCEALFIAYSEASFEPEGFYREEYLLY